MKVAYLAGVNSTLDVSRGIGAHTNALNEQLVKLEGKDFKIVGNPKEADITHITKFHPFFVSIPFTKPSKKVVLTIHDLIQLIYPKHYPPGIKGSVKFLINKYLIKKNVDRIITISETSKKDICRFLGVDPKKVHVIYLGPRKEYKSIKDKNVLENVAKKFNLPKKFVFYFGDINYNKNIPTLVEACNVLDIRLVIAGKQAADIDVDRELDTLMGPMDYIRFLFGKSHPEIKHYKDLREKFSKNKILRLGYISDEDANAIYNLAGVYVQPSHYEGFGLSVVHAMASGCPVVAAKTQALVEIAEGASFFVDPNSVDDMAAGIKEVIENKTLRNQLVESGKVLVKNFSWEKCAKETIEVYKNV